MDWQALTQGQSILGTISPKLQDLAAYQETQSGETLFRLGDRLRFMFCVVAGEVRLVRRARNGAEIVLQRSRGGFFAEASLYGKTYHCDAVVAKPGAVVRFPAQAFRDALGKDAAFRDAWMSHLAREVRQLRAQSERLGLKSAAQRIVHYIDSEGTGGAITLTETRKAWAAELGLTHEALYRALRRLQADGTLEVRAERIALNHRK